MMKLTNNKIIANLLSIIYAEPLLLTMKSNPPTAAAISLPTGQFHTPWGVFHPPARVDLTEKSTQKRAFFYGVDSEIRTHGLQSHNLTL